MAKTVKDKPHEYVEDLTTKKKTFFKDPERNYDVLCKEEFKNKRLIVHHPFSKRDGSPKYTNIKRFVFPGYSESQIPTGISKSSRFGFGFTSTLYSVGKLIDDELKPEIISLLKSGESSYDSETNTLHLVNSDIQNMAKTLKSVITKNKEIESNVGQNLLHNIFPDSIDPIESGYTENDLKMYIDKIQGAVDNFGEEDVQSLSDLFLKTVDEKPDLVKKQVVLKTRNIVEEHYIDDLIDEYKQILDLKTDGDNLEKKWHDLFSKHNWLFSHVFSFPVVLHGDEVYVGGKGLDNTGGSFTDKLLRNNLTNNVAFLEFKTHLTPIFKPEPYRDGVYAMSYGLTGSINQVLRQRDKFQKAFAVHKMNSPGNYETFNSKCIVLIGKLENLGDDELSSFELYRSNSKDAELVTFDEVFTKLVTLRKMMRGEDV